MKPALGRNVRGAERFVVWGLVALGLAAGAQGAGVADANAFLAAWLGAQGELKTWSADFTQTRTLKVLTEPLRTPGRLWFAAPDQFRWELGQPPQTIALRRTNELFVIYPRLKRAERYPMTAAGGETWRDALALLDAGFPSGRAEFDARFRVLSLVETDGLATVSLEPRSVSARKFIKEIRLTLRTSDLALTANELRFADGSSLRNDFTNALANVAIPPERFDPALPADIQVVEPLKR
ncbi:MAG: outer membrane lipoprotein carrier protein LolA [Verrucomicrobia bacterium]|nr:outer membrane lipoprotein carrier protein LolA [Verrucomicrobiota bacterium]